MAHPQKKKLHKNINFIPSQNVNSPTSKAQTFKEVWHFSGKIKDIANVSFALQK